MAQWVEQLTCKQEVAGSNPAGEQVFFFENQYYCIHCNLALQARIETGLERN